MKLSTSQALAIVQRFEEIKAAGGHAAIDLFDGKLQLRCTIRDYGDPATWGHGTVPIPFTDDHVRIVAC